jgi:hypothetical protein
MGGGENDRPRSAKMFWMAAARDTPDVIWDPRRFWPRRGRPTDARDLAQRLAVRPKGWAEHASFWISAFLGTLIVAGAATVDIIRDLEPFGLLVILALGLYGIWSGWSGAGTDTR